jgi:protein-disulfide isomerase
MVAGVVVILLLIAGGIGYAVYDSSSKPKAAYAAPQGGTSTSVLVGSASAKVTVDLYVDFQCPVCKNFEATTGPALQKLVDDRAIKIAYHPVAYLDRFSSGTRYSSRSSSAAACAADAGVFAKFAALLFANQPVENGNGLSNDKLVTLGQQAGATSADFATCIRRERYRDWTAGLTDQASKDGVNGTPTIMVDGAAVGTNGQVPTTEQVTTAIKNATA